MSGSKKAARSLPVIQDDQRPLDVRVWLSFAHVYHQLERRLAAALEGHGLSLSQFDVLATLLHGEGITQQELAERLLVTKGNVVGLIDRVSGAGWVERRPDPHDRRANRLFLTDAGRRLITEALPGHVGCIREVMGGLGESDLAELGRLLDRLGARVEE